MSNISIEINDEGLKEILKGSEMQSILKSYGDQKAINAGAGYAAIVHVHKNRAVCNVFPNTKEAAKDNYENNTLLKVVR